MACLLVFPLKYHSCRREGKCSVIASTVPILNLHLYQTHTLWHKFIPAFQTEQKRKKSLCLVVRISKWSVNFWKALLSALLVLVFSIPEELEQFHVVSHSYSLLPKTVNWKSQELLHESIWSYFSLVPYKFVNYCLFPPVKYTDVHYRQKNLK